jgi:hypothetical protein
MSQEFTASSIEPRMEAESTQGFQEPQVQALPATAATNGEASPSLLPVYGSTLTYLDDMT